MSSGPQGSLTDHEEVPAQNVLILLILACADGVIMLLV